MSEIVRVDHIDMSYQAENGEIQALEDVCFDVEQGEFISIVGPSGCGKSTLLSIISGLLRPTSGHIFINGRDVDGPSNDIGYMLQKDYLFEWRTIMQNVCLGLEIRKLKTAENMEYVEQLLKTYGLYEFRSKYPSQLSGGMRQRAALIRTLAVKPRILLLDEAFSALDYQTRLAVCEDIYGIIRKEHKTAILVTHDISESISLSDRVVVLSCRPATVKNCYEISFPKDLVSPMARREHDSFRGYFNQIWEDLDVHV